MGKREKAIFLFLRVLSFGGGLVVGALAGILYCVTLGAGEYTAIAHDVKCVETAVVGKSPNRYERCVTYKLEEQAAIQEGE